MSDENKKTTYIGFVKDDDKTWVQYPSTIEATDQGAAKRELLRAIGSDHLSEGGVTVAAVPVSSWKPQTARLVEREPQVVLS